jgi:hypothetical protein
VEALRGPSGGQRVNELNCVEVFEPGTSFVVHTVLTEKQVNMAGAYKERGVYGDRCSSASECA